MTLVSSNNIRNVGYGVKESLQLTVYAYRILSVVWVLFI